MLVAGTHFSPLFRRGEFTQQFSQPLAELGDRL